MRPTQQKLLPSLNTERLLLRQLEFTDDNAIFALRNNEQVNAFIQRPLLNDVDEARAFIDAINDGIYNKEWLYWAMILNSHQQLVGTICLWHFSPDNTKAEVGYELHPKFQGAGLMSEALKKITDYGFATLQLKTIEAYTQPANKKSVQLLLKNNFVQDVQSKDSGTSREIRFTLSMCSLYNRSQEKGSRT